MTKTIFISIIIAILVITVVHAQEPERPTPPPRETQIPETDRIEREEPRRERLPDFELPEYVITGRATFRLPYVQKAKITEQSVYNPAIPSQMSGVDRDIKTTPVDIPTRSFGEFSTAPGMQYGQLRIGYGRYKTPVLSGWANYSSTLWDASGRIYYSNTVGHEPFARGYDVDGLFQFGYRIPETAPAFFRGGRPNLTIGSEGLKYGLYEQMINRLPTTDTGHTVRNDVSEVRNRLLRTDYTQIGFQSGYDAPFDYEFRFAWRGSTHDDEDGIIPQINEQIYNLNFTTLGYFGALRFRTGVEYNADNLDFETNDILNNPRFFRGTLTTHFPLVEKFLLLDLGGSYYSTRGTHTNYSSSLKPFAEIRIVPLHSLTLYTRFAPEMTYRSLYSLQSLHPYIGWWMAEPNGTTTFVDPRVRVVVPSLRIMPSDERINITLGGEYVPDRRVNIHLYTQYREIEAYPAFESVDIHGTTNLTYLGKTKLFSLNADVRYAITDRDILTTQMRYSYSKNDFYDTTVPHIAPLEIASMYTREFRFGLRVSAGFEFLYPRRATYLGTGPESLGTVVNLNLDVQYQFHDIIGVYITFDNVLNQSYERYYTYTARPFYAEGGIQIFF
jgi:hypothetical protein